MLSESFSDIQIFPFSPPLLHFFLVFSQGKVLAPHHTQQFQPCFPNLAALEGCYVEVSCFHLSGEVSPHLSLQIISGFPTSALASMRAVSVALRYREASGHYLLGGPVF